MISLILGSHLTLVGFLTMILVLMLNSWGYSIGWGGCLAFGIGPLTMGLLLEHYSQKNLSQFKERCR
jgi:hypothetical protein